MHERKRKVLLAAQRLFVENGFTATSVQDILDEARISKGTFYNYFASKNECLIAILQLAHEEAFIRRRELSIGQNTTNKEVFVEQILIRLHVNREQNLLPIFELIFHSGDIELRNFVKKQHLKELEWMSSRIIEIYGNEITTYAIDISSLLMGALQHMTHVWSYFSKEEVNTQQLLQYILRRIDTIVPTIIEQQDQFISHNELSIAAIATTEELKAYVVEQLQQLIKQLKHCRNGSEQEIIHFLLEEIEAEEPRLFLLESINRSFREVFQQSAFESDVREIATAIWKYIQSSSKQA